MAIIKEEDYRQKMEEMLNCKDTYERQTERNMENIHTKIKAAILSIKGKGNPKEGIKPFPDFGLLDNEIARIYGLPKIHKTNAPLRPITSTCGDVIGRKLADYITEMIGETYIPAKHNVLNSTEFAKQIQEMEINADETLISFDVVSMFTNIPLEKAIELTIKHTGEKILEKYRIDNQLLGRILKLTLDDCAIFQYGGQIYKQKKGLAMGSPLSPVLAKIVMDDIIHQQITETPRFLATYVDDSIWIIKKNNILETLNKLNRR